MKTLETACVQVQKAVDAADTLHKALRSHWQRIQQLRGDEAVLARARGGVGGELTLRRATAAREIAAVDAMVSQKQVDEALVHVSALVAESASLVAMAHVLDACPEPAAAE